MEVRHPPGGGRGRNKPSRAAQVPLGPARQPGQVAVRDRAPGQERLDHLLHRAVAEQAAMEGVDTPRAAGAR